MLALLFLVLRSFILVVKKLYAFFSPFFDFMHDLKILNSASASATLFCLLIIGLIVFLMIMGKGQVLGGRGRGNGCKKWPQIIKGTTCTFKSGRGVVTYEPHN
jgi:hypothetical protein